MTPLVTPAAFRDPASHFRRGARPDRHQARRATAVLDLLRGLGGRALDYGCGWGDLTARMAPQFDQIVGVDADPARVEFARQEYAPLEFSTCQSERTDFEDGAFDVVCSIVVMPFVPSAERYLDECHRLLRPDGTLVLMIPNPESLRMLIRRWRGKPIQGRSWGGQSLDAVRTFLAQHGFVAEREGGFYEPAFADVSNAGDVALSLMSAASHALRLPHWWAYAGFRCRRVG